MLITAFADDDDETRRCLIMNRRRCARMQIASRTSATFVYGWRALLNRRVALYMYSNDRHIEVRNARFVYPEIEQRLDAC